MIKYEDLKWKESSYIIGFSILLTLGVILTIYKENQIAFFCVTLGFAILSVGLGFKALDIAKKSKEIALDSDEKMKSIVTGDFFDLANRFWDRAPDLYIDKIKGVRDTQ